MGPRTKHRVEAAFLSGEDRCVGWWYPPPRAGCPAVVLAPGFGSVREAGLARYAEHFHAAGYAVLAFDYRHFGASGGLPRQVIAIRRQLEDWTAALHWVRSQPDVDPWRVALWGTSYSSGHVITIAARDPSVSAIIAQNPFVDGLAAARVPAVSQILRLFVAALKDGARSACRLPRHHIPIVGPPGAVAAITTPGAVAGYRAMFPLGASTTDTIAAAATLYLPQYRPARWARDVRCPALLCIGEQDRVTPPGPALRAAKQMPRGQVRTYPLDHFDFYVGAQFERIVTDQVAFLREHLAPTARRLAAELRYTLRVAL